MIKKAHDAKNESVLYNDTMTLRFAIWANSIEMIKDHPFAGVGIGNFKIHYPLHHQSAKKDMVFSEGVQLHTTHNDYLQIATELGVVGLILFLGLTGAAFVLACRLLRPRYPLRTRRIVIGIVGGLAGFMVQAMFSFPMERAIPPLILYIYIAILVALFNRHAPGRTVRCLVFPQKRALWMFVTFLSIGIFLSLFHYRNLLSDHYYRSALESERKGEWRDVLEAGRTSHEYFPLRKSALSAMGRAYMKTQ